ncbi:MAG: hypothetical protein K0R00_2129 [Herbinix sp.]|jgi:hypothetical protein|nr:hypothetical protein [Herbinix sp.]
MKMKRILLVVTSLLLFIGTLSVSSIHSKAESNSKSITINGKNANTAAQNSFRGLGMISANGSSRLLLDYKDENPEAYWEIMNYLFNKETGMGLSHIKIEMGSDVNSSSGTEPSIKRTEKEIADVTRGAGFILAANALTINPDITLDMIWWSEPLWVTKAKDKYAARYKWYKETLDAAYKTYGLKFKFVSANRNEKFIETDWIIYLSKSLKAEKNSPYDYSKIKIVAADEVGSWNIIDLMLKDKELMKAVDVISSHYTSWSPAIAQKISEQYGKEIWFSEGSAPMSYSEGTYRYDGTGTGISGINGMLDIATRIITMYPEGLMNLYEFQPAVASYYSGATYFPKQLITANEPWSGYYTLDAGFYMTLHFTKFSSPGWQFIDGACAGDGKAGGDGHAIVDSTYNYLTLADKKTGDYSVIIANNTAKTLEYSINVSNLTKSQSPVDVWETRGPNDDTNYYQNYLKKINTIIPTVKGKSVTYQVKIKPYSLVTLTTLQKEEQNFDINATSEALKLPYTDDFEYKNYDKNYLADRGYAPRYTTDQGGAFEVVNLKGNKVLQQKVTYDIKASEWGYTPNPVTTLGDDNWTNYSVSADVLFSSKATGNNKLNYVGVSARYNLATVGRSGYWFQLFEDGSYKLNREARILFTSTKPLKSFDKTKWNNIKITVNKNVITCYINKKKVITYIDNQFIIASGRAALYSEFNTNYFDNFKVEVIKGTTSYSTRLDNTDALIAYKGPWEHNTMSSFRNYNRTIATGTPGSTFSFNYEGEGFAIIGAVSSGVKIKVEIDGKVIEKGYLTTAVTDRGSSYYNYSLKNGSHKVKITVLSGKYNIDAVEILKK